MKLQETLERVEASKVFEYWKKGNDDSYLSSFFKIIEGEDKNWWQLDFYDPKKDTITSFIAEKEIKLVGKDSKIFKKSKEMVKKLNLDEVSIDEKKAITIAFEVLKKKYENQEVTKKILILQNIKGTIWNISFITPTLQLLNVRIDAASGDVVEDSFKNILEFKSQS